MAMDLFHGPALQLSHGCIAMVLGNMKVSLALSHGHVSVTLVTMHPCPMGFGLCPCYLHLSHVCIRKVQGIFEMSPVLSQGHSLMAQWL
jgi:hypothetical protein